MATSSINDLFLKTASSPTPAITFAQVHQLSTIGASKATVSIQIHQFTVTTIEIKIMGSNDLANWFQLGSTTAGGAGSFNLSADVDGWAYVMVQYQITAGSGIVVLSSILSTTL